MTVPSKTLTENYAWLGSLPRLREWIGDRIISGLKLHGYAITNKDFESTVCISRNSIQDDQYGVYGPIFEKMGADAALHPDELIFTLLKDGFSKKCYDNQNFFDTDHPVEHKGKIVSVSNMQDGTEVPWFLLDCSQPIKPLLFQDRKPFKLVVPNNDSDPNLFMRKQFVFGGDMRCNAGFGLWQLAYASKAPLTKENYELARKAMQSLKSDSGKPLGIRPTHLVVPTDLEGDGRRLLKATTNGGESNEWADSAKLIVTPFIY